MVLEYVRASELLNSRQSYQASIWLNIDFIVYVDCLLNFLPFFSFPLKAYRKCWTSVASTNSDNLKLRR